NDLGFQQLGLVEGWKSVNTAPANYSAHRLLADLYSALPRHEIARVSELLQSQLLQPINITPVQPRLAETNLFILEGAGPADPAFNEFNPLFLRNRLALQTSGVVGENDTLGGEIVQSGVWGRASYSIGGFRYETDGFRENNDQDHEIYNVFAQYSLSPQTSVQAEFRHVDRETGQLDLLFDPDISLHMRNEEKGDNIRVGFRHSFSPKSDLIGSVIYQSIDIDQNHTRNVATTPPVISAKANTAFEENRKGYIAELQHLFRTEKFNLTSGIGYTDQDLETTTIIDLFDVVLPPPPFPPGLPPIVLDPPPGVPISQNTDYKRANIYAYSQIRIMDSLGITVGLSAASLDLGSQLDREQLNPKLGLTWQALHATIVRAAAFRELANTRFFSQTIEPTQVAGFNQFFDDTNGTESWRYGAAIDQTFSTNLYGGIEYSIRDLDVPLLSDPEAEAPYFNEDEQFGRAYLYWTPHNMLALSAEYQYERFDRKENPVPRGIVDVTTHRVPLGFNFSHPSGITFGFKSTYYNQAGDFQKRDSDVTFSGRDDFLVFDSVLQYRLPKRYGLVSVGVNNIFDTQFLYQDTDPAKATVIPERFVFGRITLAF
ncbi:MAG: TonB-dependent receptor, partial [Planctomycetota bacterium]